MQKSDFLKEISSLSREDIQKKLLEGSVKKKKVSPVIVHKPKTSTTKENIKGKLK